ncbi:MAG: hypothetical protein ABI707_01790 [Ferruginibacter sp.]
MNKKIFNIIFLLFALAAFFTAIYHLKSIFYPTPDTPSWRHALFVAINIFVIYGLLKRPVWFVCFVAILTLQQWYSHGSYAYMLWQKEHIIHWISVAIILFLPLLFILLLMDQKNKKQI